MLDKVKPNTIPGTLHIGKWSEQIPVYNIYDANGLNQLIGYVKHQYASKGTVLYRGQCSLYKDISPSIQHNPHEKKQRQSNLIAAINAIISDKALIDFFDFDDKDISGWDLYKRILSEATLQHYFMETFCVDFVDNHWTALWFGLYRYDFEKKGYTERTDKKATEEDALIMLDSALLANKAYPPKPCKSEILLTESDRQKATALSKQSGKPLKHFVDYTINKKFLNKMDKWKSECRRVESYNKKISLHMLKYQQDNELGHMYMFLYVADTNCPTFRGISFGEATYTVDLRKALPSTFLRPCSQHGWVVKGVDQSYNFNDGIVCVIRISIPLARELLGSGKLLSTENFFPPPQRDQGYSVLLGRQVNSGVITSRRLERIFTEGTIKAMNY